MQHRIFIVTLFAVLASYLIFSMPFAFASFASEYINGIEPIPIDFSNPQPTGRCGDGICDLASGETIESCCYDCGCASSTDFCDISDVNINSGNYGTGACKSVNTIQLIEKGLSERTFQNCYLEHKTNLTVKIKQSPASVVFENITFSLSNEKYSNTTTKYWPHPTYSEWYIIEITVPRLDDCNAGTFILTGNSLSLDIKFNDGNSEKTKTLTTSFPDIEIESWTCGDNICSESNLGESSETCCYDCPCETGYCDIATGEDKSGSCRPKLTENNLQISTSTGLSTLNLDRINTDGTKDIAISLEIFNKPKSLRVDNYYSTEIDCTDCTATPTNLVCSESGASDDVYNLSCLLSLSIQDYNVKKGYDLTPKLVFELSYLNGSASDRIYQQITKEFNIYLQGSYCGDLVCDSDLGESSSTCCYDCGCSTEQYCSVTETELRQLDQKKSEVGVCKPLNNIKLQFVSLEPSNLTASTNIREILKGGVLTKQKYLDNINTNIILNIENSPDNLNLLSSKCISGNPDITCSISGICEKLESSVYQIKCPLHIDLSGVDLSSETELNLNPILNLTIEFNDGPNLLTKELSESFGLKIKVGPGCGNGECETSLGETAATCCDDCITHSSAGCQSLYGPGSWICLTKKCINKDKFNLVANLPEQKCILIRKDIQDCSINFKDLSLFITSPPGVGEVNITDSECNYKFKKINNYTFKDPVGKFSIELEETNENYQNYSIAPKSGPLLEKFNKSWFSGNLTEGPIDIDCTVIYGDERTVLNTTGTLTVVLEIHEKVLECNEKEEEIKDAYKKLEGVANKEIGMAKMFSMLSMLFMIAGILCMTTGFLGGGGGCQKFFILAAFFSLLANKYKKAAEKTMNLRVQEFDKLKQDFMDLCQSYTSEESYEHISKLNAESVLAAKSEKLKKVGMFSKLGLIGSLYGIIKGG